MTGEPMREVNFDLPASDISLLRTLPGFEDFDPQKKVLHCDKPGTGLVDAPRAFSIQLRGVTESKCNMNSSQVDGELCLRHIQNRLVAMLTKHVDDLKLTGDPDPMKSILSELQKVFGELKVEWYTFTNCGVRHIQNTITMEITLDQIDYAKSLCRIVHPQLQPNPKIYVVQNYISCICPFSEPLRTYHIRGSTSWCSSAPDSAMRQSPRSSMRAD